MVKNGNHIDLIEVKSKSFDPSKDMFLTRKGAISGGWQSYLYDVAFQKYVVRKALTDYSVSAYLMMADKTAVCQTDGLNQKFKLVTDYNGRKSVTVNGVSPVDLESPILYKVNVDDCCEVIYGTDLLNYTFSDCVKYLADHYRVDKKITTYPGAACGNCEFHATDEDLRAGLKCGFRECWKESLGWSDSDFTESTVLDIWDFRRKDHHFAEGRVKIAHFYEEDIGPKNDGKPGISRTERQWLQIRKEQTRDESYWIDRENLLREMDSWVFPLHFIDFETTMVAIPFNRGRRPYEGIAFQYSHHIVYEDGKVDHFGQYLNTIPGMFPNYEFIRNLKKELENDKGSIFRYAAHENTFLNHIYQQLKNESDDIPDRDELCTFIQTISKSVKESGEKWQGNRNMIDMLALVKRYYYNPSMKGSNSIKKVLPAILNDSSLLKSKYAQPIYGAEGGISSHNYKDWQWIVYDNEIVKDPYLLLPKMFSDIPDKELILLSETDELKDGGAALTAYARMQFEEMSGYEREEIRRALLKYCELDTMAMVMIYEGWRDLIK